MQDEGRSGNLRKERLYVYLIYYLANPDRVLWRGSYPLKIVEPLHLFGRRIRYEPRGEDLSKRSVFSPVRVPESLALPIRLFSGFPQPASRETATVGARVVVSFNGAYIRK